MSDPTVDPRPFERTLARVDARPSRLIGPIRVALRLGSRLCGFRLVVEGREHLPRGPDGRVAGGWILAGSPHRAWVDPLLLLLAWPADGPRLAWLGDGPTLVRSWWRRLLLPALEVIPVVPGSGPAAMTSHARAASRVLGRGAVLALFVERGAPSPPDRTREIAGGFAWMALAADADVVPVVIGGAHRIVRGSPFIVQFLAPLPRPALAPGPGESGAGSPGDSGSPGGRGCPGQPLDRSWRAPATALVDAYCVAVTGPVRDAAARADARAPRTSHWRWLATLFH
jgi:1-acyl-sn-glycerol-3-phosphate acyltransferase